jgi:hypothetical protein
MSRRDRRRLKALARRRKTAAGRSPRLDALEPRQLFSVTGFGLDPEPIGDSQAAVAIDVQELQATAGVDANSGLFSTVQAGPQITLNALGVLETGRFDESAAEIAAYDPGSPSRVPPSPPI